MKKKSFQIVAYTFMIFYFIFSYNVYADVRPCDRLDEDEASKTINQITVYNGDITEYKKGDKVYVDVYGVPRSNDVEIQVLLKPTVDPNGRMVSVYLKNISNKNETSGETFFIIPDEAVIGETYEIWGYNYYRKTDEIKGYGVTPEGEKSPFYKEYCSSYVTKKEDANSEKLYINNSFGKVTVVEEYKEIKDVLKSVTVDKNYTYFGGTLTFNVSTTEPVNSISLFFYNGTDLIDGHYYGYFTSNLFSDGTSKDFSFTVSAPSYGANYVYPGNFTLSSVIVYYNDGSYTRYSTDKSSADSDRNTLYFNSDMKITLGKPILDILKESQFSLKDLTLQKQETEVGMTVPVKFDWYYNSVNIKMLSARLFFRGNNNTSFSAYLKDLNKDTTIIIPSSAEEGEYKLESLTLTFDSYVGETNTIILDEESIDAQYKDIFTQKINITKKDESATSTDAKLYYYVEELTPKTLEAIKNTKENSVITIYANSQTVIPAELFESLKESGKQLIIINDKNEWVISGTDIESSKPVDVSLKYYDVKELDIPNDLKESFNGDSVVLEFTENGKLPGKVLMRLKDEELLNKLNGDKYYVYHIDEENSKLDKVAIEIQKSYDGYVEFYINHNSKYVITSKEVKNNDVIGKDDEMLSNNTVVAERKANDPDNSTSNTLLIICLCVIVVLILTIIVILRRKPRNEKKDDVKEAKDKEIKDEEIKETK